MNIIKIPKNVTINSNCIEKKLLLKSHLGELSLNLNDSIFYIKKENHIELKKFNKTNEQKNDKKDLNLYQALIQKKIRGITQGFKTNLYFNGLGFKAQKLGNTLTLKLGFSHEINVEIPESICVTIQKPTVLLLSSTNWIKLSQFISKIRKYKRPEPYKGKGILFKDENILRKEGKKK